MQWDRGDEHPPYHGTPATIWPPSFDIEQRYSDGANLYQYLRSGPWQWSDPTGLYGTPLDTAMMGWSVGKFANELMSQAAFYQEVDADWAMDWGAADDTYAATDNDWIDAMVTNFVHGEVTVFNGVMANKIVDMTKGLKRAAGTWSKTELHHIIPKFLGGLPKGAVARLPVTLHRTAERHLHARINDLCKARLGVSPHAKTGTDGILHALGELSPTKLNKFRGDLYKLFKEFDQEYGTSLAREFSKELANQRATVGQKELRGILR